jgi:hypothetical protein
VEGAVQVERDRPLLEQDRIHEALEAFAAVEWTFERLDPAVDRYRRAAEALQDLHF